MKKCNNKKVYLSFFVLVVLLLCVFFALLCVCVVFPILIFFVFLLGLPFPSFLFTLDPELVK